MLKDVKFHRDVESKEGIIISGSQSLLEQNAMIITKNETAETAPEYDI